MGWKYGSSLDLKGENMNLESLDKWLDANKNIEWWFDEDKSCFYFRDTNTRYYQDHPEAATVVSLEAMERISFLNAVGDFQ